MLDIGQQIETRPGGTICKEIKRFVKVGRKELKEENPR